MIRIEAMTRHAIIKGGVAEDEIALLVNAALHGHAPSRRKLEGAVGHEIDVRNFPEDPSCPLKYVLPRYRYQATLYAVVDLPGGYSWYYNRLYGTLPETLKDGIIGRSINDIIDAKCFHKRLITRKSVKKDALLEVDPTLVDLPRPGRIQRLLWQPRRWVLFLSEGVTDGPKPSWMLQMMGIVTAILALMLANNIWGNMNAHWISTAMLTAGVANGLWFIANGMRRRQFSLLTAFDAQSRHLRQITS